MSDSKYVLPGETRASVVIGLRSQSSAKWKLFLNGGPYWNYIAKVVLGMRIFGGEDTRLDDVVNTTIAKVAKALAAGQFVYREEGKGYFRAFLKTVARRVALDLMRKERNYFSPIVGKGGSRALDEKDVLADGVKDASADSKSLDRYDSSAMVSPAAGRIGGCKGHLASFEDLAGMFDDGERGTADPAAMQRYGEECTREEQKFLRRVQKNVFSLALVSVLSDETVPLARREMLNMLYVGRMTPADIYALDDFRTLKRGTFDKKVFDARQSLFKPILAFWNAVAPKSCENSEEELQKLWRALLVKPSTRKLAKATLKRLKDNGEMPEGIKM